MTIGLSILATPVWTVFYNINHYGGDILKIMVFNALVGNISLVVSTAEATEEASGRRILPLERYIRVGQSICMAEAGMIV